MNAFVQAQFKYNKVDFFAAVNISRSKSQREGCTKMGVLKIPL
jgi:hypothetical protein